MSITPRRTADERRTDVIHAAMIEFGTFGYHGGSTERIARESGISQPYVLRLFGTKLNLFVATLDDVCETIMHTWQQALDSSPESGSGWEALMVLGQSYAQGVNTAMRFRMIMQGAAAASTPEVETAINSGMDRLWNWVQANTGATHEELQRFWAFGMMQTMGISMNAHHYVASSDRARAMVHLPGR